RPCYAHRLLLPTGTKQTGMLLRHSLHPFGSLATPLCPPTTRSPPGSTDIFRQYPPSSSITHRRNAPLFNQSHGGQTNLVRSAALSTQPPVGAESSLLPSTSTTEKTSRISTFTLASIQRPPNANSSWQL